MTLRIPRKSMTNNHPMMDGIKNANLRIGLSEPTLFPQLSESLSEYLTTVLRG
jgi:hypothetical protein